MAMGCEGGRSSRVMSSQRGPRRARRTPHRPELGRNFRRPHPCCDGCRSDLSLPKSLLRASNCNNTIHDVRLRANTLFAVRLRLLYHRHAAALWRYALRLTSDPGRSEDLVQETLLRAWMHSEISDDSERSARAWLFTVARNIIIDESRSSRFRNEVRLHESAEMLGVRRCPSLSAIGESDALLAPKPPGLPCATNDIDREQG
jgi:hypothetical protein